MKSRDFCYWLQGYFELVKSGDGLSLNGDQLLCVEKHLKMVFAHEIDPSMGDEGEQDKLNKIHNPNVKLRC